MTLLYSEPCFLQHETGRHPESADRIRLIPARLEEEGLDSQVRPARVDAGRPASTHRDPLARVRQPGLGAGQIGRRRPRRGHGRQPLLLRRCPAGRRLRLRRHRANPPRRGPSGVVPGPPAGTPRPGEPGHGILSVQQRGDRRPDGPRRVPTRSRADRRLGHPSRQRHAGELLPRAPRRLPFDPPRRPSFRAPGPRTKPAAATGRGTTLNLPVRRGISREEYLGRFSDGLEAFAARLKPQLILLSAGFDTHRLDPVGSLGLETEDFIALTDLVLDAADAHAGGRARQRSRRRLPPPDPGRLGRRPSWRDGSPKRPVDYPLEADVFRAFVASSCEFFAPRGFLMKPGAHPVDCP